MMAETGINNLFSFNYDKMLFLIYILGLFSGIVQGDIEYDSRLQIGLDHALDDSLEPEFKMRGEVSLPSLHSGSAGLDQIRLKPREIAQLKELAAKGENYRLRATVKTLAGKETTFYTFTPACALLESKLHDILYISLDNVGNVVSVTLATETPCSHSGYYPSNDGELITSVYVRHMESGPIPDTASYIQKFEREKEAKDRGETKDNRSFLAKYWMYIVPVVIFILISGASNPEAGGGGQ